MMAKTQHASTSHTDSGLKDGKTQSITSAAMIPFKFPNQKHDSAIPVDYGHCTKLERGRVPEPESVGKIYTTKTESFRPANISVLANYVHVKTVPGRIYVYSIANCHDFARKNKPN
jgi:hypothetical protein